MPFVLKITNCCHSMEVNGAVAVQRPTSELCDKTGFAFPNSSVPYRPTGTKLIWIDGLLTM